MFIEAFMSTKLHFSVGPIWSNREMQFLKLWQLWQSFYYFCSVTSCWILYNGYRTWTGLCGIPVQCCMLVL